MNMNFDEYVKYLNGKFASVTRTEDDIDDYQWDAIDAVIANPKFSLFIDTGLGKTLIMLYVIKYLVDRGEVNKILVTAPLKVSSRTWEDEIKTWSFSAPITYKQIRTNELKKLLAKVGRAVKEDISNNGLPVKQQRYVESNIQSRLKKMQRDSPDLDLSSPKVVDAVRHEVMKSAVDYCVKNAKLDHAKRFFIQNDIDNPATINLINQENLDFLIAAWGDDFPYDMIIYDESSGAKNATSNRVKALFKVSGKVKRIVGLTATPNSENYLGLWAQMYLLDNGKRLGRRYSDYIARYFDVNPWTRSTTLKPDADKLITAAISDITMVMKQEDHVKLPPPVFNDVIVKLTPDARVKYMSMSDGGIVTVGGATIVADTVVSTLQKMMQIASGFVYEGVEDLDDFGDVVTDRVAHDIHDCKIDALRDLRAKYKGEPMLVSYYHKQSLVKLMRAFPDAVKMDAKATQQTAWNKGEIPLLLMHPKSGAHGLNLQFGGHHVVNFDTYFSYEQYYQFWRRLARRGQRDQVYVHNLLVEDSYDMVVRSKCWLGKKKKQEAFFDMLQLIRKYGMTEAIRRLQ